MEAASRTTAATLELKRPAMQRRASFPFTELKTPRKEGTNMIVPSDGTRPAICVPKAEICETTQPVTLWDVLQKASVVLGIIVALRSLGE
jgi:hypothetical protein